MTVFLAILTVLAAIGLVSLILSLWTGWRHHPHGAFVHVGDVRLHYVDRGPANPTGAPLVFVHGASGNLRDFDAGLAAALSATHRVICFDRPGHGWSERPADGDMTDPAAQADLLHAAIDHLGVRKPVLMGHSWGGAVAAAYALRHGESLSGLLVLSGATHPWEGAVAWYHRWLKVPVLGTLFLRLVVLPLGRLFAPAGVRSVFWPDDPPQGYVEATGLHLLFRSGHFRHNSADTAALKTHLARQAPSYGQIRVPTIIITGNRDQTVMAKTHSYELHRQISGSEMIKLEGVGHAPHHVRADVVEDALRRLAAAEAPRPGTHIVPPQTDAQKAALNK